MDEWSDGCHLSAITLPPHQCHTNVTTAACTAPSRLYLLSLSLLSCLISGLLILSDSELKESLPVSWTCHFLSHKQEDTLPHSWLPAPLHQESWDMKHRCKYGEQAEVLQVLKNQLNMSLCGTSVSRPGKVKERETRAEFWSHWNHPEPTAASLALTEHSENCQKNDWRSALDVRV